MPKVLIIADDLTGAADCGAMFADSGFASIVLLAGPEESAVGPEDFEEADVSAIDTDTRCVRPEQAAECVARIVQDRACGGPAAGADLIFKKVDSTLRGNVAAELAGALQAMRAHASPSNRIAILFAPAFPACGRTTVNGRQLVDGEPLENSDAWRRERIRPHSEIAAMLGEAGLSCALLELACVRSGEVALKNGLLKKANEADVVICDAESDSDLESIARAGMLMDKKTMWAGSAGLARHIARTLAVNRAVVSERSYAPRVRGPLLFVVGSSAVASREQARTLAGAPDLSVFTFSRSELLLAQPSSATLVFERLANGGDVFVQFASSETGDAQQGLEMTRSLARIIRPCVIQAGALVATGGETARAILDAWSIRRLRLLGEIEPGLPYSIAHHAGREILILTKAGGFGTRETLLRCRELLHSDPVAARE